MKGQTITREKNMRHGKGTVTSAFDPDRKNTTLAKSIEITGTAHTHLIFIKSLPPRSKNDRRT